jgi:hypothetical protein
MSAIPIISLAAVNMEDAAENSELSPLGSPVAVDDGSPIDTLQRTVHVQHFLKRLDPLAVVMNQTISLACLPECGVNVTINAR